MGTGRSFRAIRQSGWLNYTCVRTSSALSILSMGNVVACQNLWPVKPPSWGSRKYVQWLLAYDVIRNDPVWYNTCTVPQQETDKTNRTQPICCWSWQNLSLFLVEKLPGRPRFPFEIQIALQMKYAEKCQDICGLKFEPFWYPNCFKTWWNASELSSEVFERRCSWERPIREALRACSEKVAYL